MKDLKLDDVRAALEELSMYELLNNEISMDSIAEYFKKEDVHGSEVKAFFKALDIFDRRIKNKEENIGYFINNFSINGVKSTKAPNDSVIEINDEKTPSNIISDALHAVFGSKSKDDTSTEEINTAKPEDTPNDVKTDKIFVDSNIHDISAARQYYDVLKASEQILKTEDAEGLWFSPSAENKVYEGISIISSDNISIESSVELNESFVLLTNGNGNVVLVGEFIKDDGKYVLEAEKSNIDFDGMKNRTCFNMITASRDMKVFYSTDIDISVKEPEYTDKVLCVDFGTSNTVLGTYENDDIRLVKFNDVTAPVHTESFIYPTIVYVKKCDPENKKVDYLFGYEAKKVLIDNNYLPKGSIYFEIKRWITSLDVTETIVDENGINMTVKRREILRDYLRHLVRKANIYFKCAFGKAHFTAPVQLKNKFIDFLQKDVFNSESFPLEVENASNSIDEGVAIIYKYISDQIKYYDNDETKIKKEKILVVDCGGGTTDLASCEYEFVQTDTGYELKIDTTAENGNSNFGGNNITYRIFQLLKIKLADYYSDYNSSNSESISVNLSELLSFDDNDVLNIIDECVRYQNKLTIYDKLDKTSFKCEEILPTDFNNKNNKYANSKQTKNYAKRNFYYLWQLAEKVKIEFFNRTDLVSIDFHKKTDKKIVVSSDDSLFFYIKNSNADIPPLVKTAGVPEIEINTKEISTLLKPEIYYLLASIFKININTDIILDDFDIIKFSGQSCKISLFQELIKEFVAGKKLRNADKRKDRTIGSEALKLECIEGSIAYIRDRENHMINPCISPRKPNLTYEIRVSRGKGMKENYLIDGKNFRHTDDEYVALPLYIDQHNVGEGELNITIANIVGEISENKIIEKIHYKYNENDKITITDLKNEILSKSYINEYYVGEINELTKEFEKSNDTLVDKLIDDIRGLRFEGITKKLIVFAVPNSDGFGFVLYQVVVIKEDSSTNYYLTSTNVHMFEDGLSKKSFFNGFNCDINEEGI